MKAVVFGAGGAVGRGVVRQLSAAGDAVVAVSRSGKIAALAGLPGVEFAKADCGAADQVAAAAKGAEVIFCCVGLPEYNADVWEAQWPPILKALLAAAKENDAGLVFCDNLYMYGPEAKMPLTSTDEAFTSFGRKPKLRAQLDRTMLEAHRSGSAKVALVRAPDFFGPEADGHIGSYIVPHMIRGSRMGMMIAKTNKKHSYAYVPDVSTAMIAVARDPSSWGRAWHVPCPPAETTHEILQRMWTKSGNKGKVKYISFTGLMRRATDPFVRMMREMTEMSYTFKSDYIVASDDFSAKFPDVQLPTPMDKAVEDTLAYFKEKTAAKK